ncbi:MAG: hypothetical protein HFH80_12985 [Lachnospiraceae bacterium]|nr:hypothetical protein [Lachnospiraceae bacterium]
MKRWQIRGGIAVFLLLVMAVAGSVAVPVYYLNDDVTMRSILSGAYTGTPDGHAVYMGYPLTALLAALYSLTGRLGLFIPWFDLFLAGCILLTGAGILVRCWEAGDRPWARGTLTLLGLAVFAGMLLPHYLYIHYTIVAAILGGGALFMWETGKGRALPVCLLGLCYLVRSQVFFLVLPFLGVAVLDGLLESLRLGRRGRQTVGDGLQGRERQTAGDGLQGREQRIAGGGLQGREQRIAGGGLQGRERQTAGGGLQGREQRTAGDGPGGRAGGLRAGLRREALPLLILGVLTLIFWGVGRIGYGSRDWQVYQEYNDSRTKLYDYTDFLSTDWYQERYELLGLTQEQYQVLAHYDILLDQEIDAGVLARTARRVKSLRGDVVADEYLRQCLGAYVRHLRYDGRPYSLVWAGCCGVLLLLLAVGKRWDRLLLLGALAGGRSLVWVYLIARGRFPERIWLSLYLLEICLLLGMTLREWTGNREAVSCGFRRFLPAGTAVLMLTLLWGAAAVQLPHTLQMGEIQRGKQEQWNTLSEALEGQEDLLYLMDVFSAVAYAGELYGGDSEQIMLLGGWLTHSPLARQRLAEYGASDAAQALEHPRVRLVAAGDRDMTWLEEYLCLRLGKVRLREQESISCEGGAEFVVYKLETALAQ